MSRFRALLQATKKALTWNVEDLVPPTERYIFNFNSKEEVKKWHLYSDSEYGGLSSASLEISDTGNGPNGSCPILSLMEAYHSFWKPVSFINKLMTITNC
ncbi:hypothetical protein M0R45_026585 [Rubus argutus]|uniref:NADH:ubiquinone oxidoreductase intermediate-associated protein 30 domain-containing protein n=1 Tax=Rubus argutus TaxID=59490 RepID=A0AAW1X0B6_RUBAR